MTTLAPGYQWETALTLANETRTARAALKARVRSGEVTFWEAVESGDPLVQGMRVADLLRAVPAWGKVKVDHTLALAEISTTRTVGRMTQRQWDLLVRYAGLSAKWL